MTDENIVHVAPQPAQPTPANDNAEHTLIGKIARLPHDIREQLNQRIRDGKSGSEILPWLNDLPAVKEILAAQFDGIPVHKQNLTVWRQAGYQRWLRDQQRVSALKDRCQYAAQINEADSGHLAPAAATAASDKILEFLDDAESGKMSPDHLVKYGAVASALKKAQQNDERIKIAHERLRQREMLILLKRDKQQRDSVAGGLRVLKDVRAKQIEASSANQAEKIELLGIHLFGDLWEPRPIPNPEDFNQAPNHKKDQQQK
jgi:hypothetical protein